MPKRSVRDRGRLEALVVGGLTLIGLVLRLALWHTQSIPSGDGIAYIRIAQGLLHGNPVGTVHQLGYPILILAGRAVAGDWIPAARGIDLGFGVLLIPVVWRLAAKVVKTPWLRLLPAVAVAGHPLFVRYSLTTMSESPYLVLMCGMFTLAVAARWRSAGAMGGLAYAVRPEALIACAVLGGLLVRRRRALVHYGLGAVVVVGGYVLVQGLATGKWAVSQKTSNVAASSWVDYEVTADGETPRIDTAERVKRFGGSALKRYPERLVESGGTLFSQSGWASLPAAAAGMVTPGGLLVSAGLAQFWIMPLVSQGGQLRFQMLFLIAIWVLAAAGIEELRGTTLKVGAAAACLAGLAASAGVHRSLYVTNEEGYFPEMVTAGKWLGTHADPEAVVYDRKPYVAFYAGTRQETIPLGTYEEMIESMVNHGGDFLVAGEDVIRHFRGQLTALVEDLGGIRAEHRLTPVYYDDQYAGRRTVIYRVNRRGSRFSSLPSVIEQMSDLPHGPNHRAHGVVAMKNDDFDLAAREFALALDRAPNDAEVMALRARMLVEMGRDLPEAEALTRRSLEIDPGSVFALETLALALARQGREEEAAALLKTAGR